jgi:hypothetical protein
MPAVSARVLRLGVWACALALVAWVALLAPRGFLSGDSGVKLVQAHGLWLSGFASRALPYDHEVDPEERYFPYQREDFTRVVHGERQGTYSLVFCGLLAALLGLFGLAALPILGVAGALLVIWGLYRAAARSGLGPGLTLLAVATAALATPVLFYASQLTEHTLAAGLAIAALARIAPLARAPGSADPGVDTIQIRPGSAGVLTALAATMRPEAYCMVAALGLAVALLPGLAPRVRVRHGLAYLAGCVPVLAGYWLVNLATAGTWDPLVSANSSAQKAASGHDTLVFFWGELPGASRPGLWLALAALPALAGLIPPRLAGRAAGSALRALVAIAIAVAAWRAQGLGTGRALSGFFCVTPLLALGLLAGPWRPRNRAPWLAAVLYLGQVAILPSGGNAGGLQLGARLLMPALPLLCLLAAFAVEDDLLALRARWQRALVALVLLAVATPTVLGNDRGTRQAMAIARQGEVIAQRAAEAPGNVVIVRRGWESQLVAPVLLAGKAIYEVRSDLRKLAEALHARGERAFAVVDKTPVTVRLSGDRQVRTVQSVAGWLHLQHVVIDAPAR